jgi:hypothetical protein
MWLDCIVEFALRSSSSVILCSPREPPPMADQAQERDARTSAREARAEQYFEQDLKGQRRWYSEHSSA